MFETLKTGIDGLDAILAGGIRYPSDGAAFVFLTGGPGSGKTMLALELVTRAWLDSEDGATSLYYSVEHAPDAVHRKLQHDFDYFGVDAEIVALPAEVPTKLCLEARHADGRTSRLVLTKAEPAGLEQLRGTGPSVVNVDWILAEIGNYTTAGPVRVVCVDNVSLLLTDLDYFGKRSALLETRRQLLDSRIHGIFVQEVTHANDPRMPSAEEFSTDLLIDLSFQNDSESFKARTIEIAKARHQYYYRGAHHFSIAGRALDQEGYLGARSERGPGLHIYPSVAAQLSLARDSHRAKVPDRGVDVIDMGHPAFLASFLDGTGPTARSSTVLLAEPSTRYTYLAMRFLAAGQRDGETTMMVSTKEDEDALSRICARHESLKSTLLEDDGFAAAFRVVYLHPEFISAGKFTWDIMQQVLSRSSGAAVTRLAFDNIFRLHDRFPLLEKQRFMIPALLDMLRYAHVTPLFIDLVPPGSARGRVDFNPASYMTTFDNVFHLFLEEQEDGGQRPCLRVLKSAANDFTRRAVPIDYEIE